MRNFKKGEGIDGREEKFFQIINEEEEQFKIKSLK